MNHLQEERAVSFYLHSSFLLFPLKLSTRCPRPNSELLSLSVILFKERSASPIKITPTQRAGICISSFFPFSVCVVFIRTRRQLLNINNNNKPLAEAASKDPYAGCSMDFLATNNSSWLLLLELHPPGVGVWKWSVPHRWWGIHQLHKAPKNQQLLGNRGEVGELEQSFSFL